MVGGSALKPQGASHFKVSITVLVGGFGPGLTGFDEPLEPFIIIWQNQRLERAQVANK
jgi:hypothetical protein